MNLLDQLAAAAPAPEPAAPVPEFRWVPIRSLSERHRPRIRTHLLALSPADRYLRFGHPATDAQIGNYVDRIDFDRDEVFGVFNRRLTLIALGHLAYLGDGHAAEFGVSVLPHARGRSIGARLFDHAVLHARNRDVDTLVIHALTENVAMLRIARGAGATVERSGSDSEARLKLPPNDLVSRVGVLVEDHAAELNYQFKLNARRVDGLLEAIEELKHGMRQRRIASE